MEVVLGQAKSRIMHGMKRKGGPGLHIPDRMSAFFLMTI